MNTVVSISVPKEVNVRISEIAKEQRRSKSQIVVEAFEKYNRDLAWREIRQEGDRVAKQLGIESDDDVEKIFGRKANRSI